MNSKILILLIITSIVSCRPGNKLNSNEKKLAAQIVIEEQENQDAEAALRENESIIHDSLPLGFRFQEDRSVDPNNPPELVDIAGNIENIKEIKLSDIANRVRYIRLAPPPDSLFIYRKPKIQFTKNNIIATSQLATCIYSLSGEFLDLICKNELTESLGATPPFPKDIPYFSKYNNVPNQLKTIRRDLLRMQNRGITDIYDNNFTDEIIYFKYRDRVGEKSYLMKYDVTTKSHSLKLPKNIETSNQIVSKGEKLAPLENRSPFRYHILDENTKIGYQSKWNSVQNGIMLILENINGDTLCIFNEPERVANYDASVVRGVESGSKYFFKNEFIYRPSFNDTVFRLVPPNRLLPVFVINLGIHKITALEALHPKYNLDGKFLIKEWVETPQNIFILYTENRTSIHHITNKKVKFFYACYDKILKELFHFPVDPFNYVYEIENDIDGGLALWPEQTNLQGELYRSFEGWELKRHVESNEFKQSDVAPEKRERMLQMAEAVGNAETIIMIIE